MKNRTMLIILVAIYIIFAILALQGCDNVDCRPDGAVEANKKDFWIGLKCGGKF